MRIGYGEPMAFPGGPAPGPDDPTQWTPLPPAPGYPGPAPWRQPPGPPPPGWNPAQPRGYPPPAGFGGDPPGPPRRSRGLLWAALAAVCVLAIGAVVFVVLTRRDPGSETDSAASTSGTSSTAPAATALVPVSALGGLFPGKDTIAAAAGDPNLGVVSEEDGMAPGRIVDQDCQGIYSVGAEPVYAGSGWTASHYQRWLSPPEPNPQQLDRAVLLSVALYPQPAPADAFYAKQSAAWKGCANRTINVRDPAAQDGADEFWTVGEVTESDNVVRTVITSEGGNGWAAQHAMLLRDNAVVRVGVVGYTIPDGAVQALIDAITQKIDAAA